MKYEVLDYDKPTLDKLYALTEEALHLAYTSLKSTRFQSVITILGDAAREIRKARTEAREHKNEEPKDKYDLSEEEDTSLRNIVRTVGRFDLGRFD